MNNPQNLTFFLNNSSSIYYIIIDTEGRFAHVNNLFTKIFGYHPENVYTEYFQDRVFEEDVPDYKMAIDECLANPGKTSTVDIRRFRGDKSMFWTRWEFCVGYDESNKITSLQGIGNDITERKRAELEKQEAQKNLQILLDNTDESFVMVDKNLEIISYNKAANESVVESFGVPLKKGLPVVMFAEPGWQEEHERLMYESINNKTHEVVASHKMLNGSNKILSHKFKPVFREDGNPLGLIITSNDVTEKRKAEDQLLKNEKHFRALIENSADALIVINEAGGFSDITPTAERILGYSAEELRQHIRMDFIHRDDLQLVRQTFREVALRERAVKTIEFRAITSSGTERWLSGTFHNLLIEPDIQGIVVNFSDISDKREAQKLLQLSEEKYRFLFFSNPQPMWVYDLNTFQFIEVNASALSHYGYTEQEFLSMNIFDIRPGEDYENVMERISEIRETPGLHHSEKSWRHKKKNGEIIYVEIKSHTLDYNGREAVLVSVNDLTTVVLAEIALKRSNERFTYAVKATSEAIWEWDILNQNFYIADAFTNMLGWPTDPAKKFGYYHQYLHEEDKEQVLKTLHDALEDPATETWNAEYRFRRPSGEYAFLADRGWIIRDGYGKAIKVVGSLRDMTSSKQFEQELLTSKERFELAGRATSDAIWDADLINQTIHWGEGFETLFGFEAGDTEDASSWINHIHPEDKERVIAEHVRVVNEEPEVSFWKDEYRYFRADGSIAYVTDRGIIMRDEEGKPYRMIGAMQDITEHKEAEEKLTSERYLLRTLIDHLPDYIYVKDTSLRHIINNKANVELIGAGSEEETLGKKTIEYYEDADSEVYNETDKKILETGVGIHNLEEAIITRNGEKRWLLTTRVPLLNDHNKVFGMVAISRDITSRKNIEESLRHSIERYNIVTKATNDAIWDWDLHTNEVVWNEAVKTLFGYDEYSIGEFSQWREDKIHPSDRVRVVSGIYRNIQELRENWVAEYRFACADGTYKYIYDRGHLLLDENRKPYRMIGAMVDITDRRTLEEELAAQKIMRQRQITEATIQAQEKERSEIGRELHDNINQILTTTKLYIDMAINEDEIREELLHKSYRNVSQAIEEIRILSKSLVPPSLGDIGIKEAIAEMIGNLSLAQKLTFNLKTTGFSRYPISGNKKLMVFRIVQEQINNIVKHSNATHAEIKLAVSGKMLNITVTDNGVGFDPKRKTKGIGLSNITSRAELYNGKVDIISEPGKGTILKVAIPV